MKATEGNEQLKQVLALSGKLGSAKEFTKHHDGDNRWILPGAFSRKRDSRPQAKWILRIKETVCTTCYMKNYTTATQRIYCDILLPPWNAGFFQFH